MSLKICWLYMESCDTNILLYYLDSTCPENSKAKKYIDSVIYKTDFYISELVLAELYTLLRSPKILKMPYNGVEAAKCCMQFRRNPNWGVIECIPGVMENVWRSLTRDTPNPFRIYDLRLGYSLKQAGVTRFATRNTKDFITVGFKDLINPID